MRAKIEELGNFLGFPLAPREAGVAPLVVTSENGVEGAMALFMDGVLEECCVRLECEKLFLLPCSIHEWIVLPYVAARTRALVDIIHTTNRDVVAGRDYLSNRLFSWDRYEGLQEEAPELFAPIEDELCIMRNEDDITISMEGGALCLD